MQKLDNESGVVDLFTADGGVGEQKWYCIRIATKGTSVASGFAQLRVNGNPTTLAVAVAQNVDNHDHDHLLLTTGDVVDINLTNSCSSDLVVSANVDTEEL